MEICLIVRFTMPIELRYFIRAVPTVVKIAIDNCCHMTAKAEHEYSFRIVLAEIFRRVTVWTRVWDALSVEAVLA